MDHDAERAATPADPGYETRDADTRGIVVFGVWLFLLLVVVHVGLFGLYELFVRRSPPPQAASAESPDNIYEQLRSMRQAEDETLSTYGWVDRKAGVVRIPIDRAIDLVATRGVPKGKGPRPEAEVHSHHGMPAKADEAKAEEKDTKAAPGEKKP